MWLLTYDRDILPSLDESHAVALLHDILQGAKREKVLRLCLYTLRNMLEVQTFVQEMVSVGLYRSLKRLEKRKFADSDIPTVLGSIRERLDSEIILLSSFDQYYQEVRTGRLDWTPAHKSEKFWRENMERFEAKDFEVVRELAKLLDTSIDNRTVAVVCHDLGEFSRLHPRGKKIIRNLSVKEKIMRMMTTHNDEEVRKEALVCIQKMMVQNWEFLRS
jgi:V-type H+-transporting ATPase subunit H